MMQPLEHVFFDFDGVLCDSLSACVEEYDRLRTERFPQLPGISQSTRMNIAFAGALKTSLRPWLSEEESRAFFDAHSAAMRGRSEGLRTFDGVDALLNELPAKSASVVSSAYNSAIATAIATGSGDLPPSILSLEGRDSGLTKTEKILGALERCSIPPDRAIYVGDLHSDLLYCDQVPVACILVTYGYQTRGHLEGVGKSAFALVDSVEELANTLTKLMLRSSDE